MEGDAITCAVPSSNLPATGNRVRLPVSIRQPLGNTACLKQDALE